MQALDEYNIVWAADNDCYTDNFRPDIFEGWLYQTTPYQERCLFVACPDVVGDAQATMALFAQWGDRLRSWHYPVALVLQDGMLSDTIPWSDIDAVFVGGTTKWKLGQDVLQILKIAGSHGLHRHVGRVNSMRRLLHFWDVAESFDGTDYVHRPRAAVKQYLSLMKWRRQQLELGL